MKSASFVVDLSQRRQDETVLWWDHAVLVTLAQAELESPLGGEAPALVYVDGAGERLSMWFSASCERGARRVARPARPMLLPARERLKVWGLRAEEGGILRVRLQYHRPAKIAPSRANPVRTAPLSVSVGFDRVR